MSEYRHPGLHPDADSLGAFAEGVLPEHERLECLAHLSECARCREIVYLAQEPVAEPVPVHANPAPRWKRWFAPIPVFSTAAVVCAVAILTVVSVRKQAAPPPVLTASVTGPVEIPPPPVLSLPAPAPAKLALPPLKVTRPEARITSQAQPPSVVAGVPPEAAAVPQTAPFAPAVAAARAAPIPTGAQPQPSAALASVEGSVTDATGATIPGATVSMRLISGNEILGAKTDTKGQFILAGLLPGPYEMKVDSPGFSGTSQRIEVEPRQMIRANSVLQVGSQAQQVTVEAAVPSVTARSSALGSVAAPKTEALPLNGRNYSSLLSLSAGAALVLPNKLTAAASARKDQLVVAADSTGILFFSKNGGKNWKKIKPVWRGKAVSLAIAPDSSAPGDTLFRLTTDLQAVWLSRDGTRWFPAPASR